MNMLKVPSWQRAITKPKDGTAPQMSGPKGFGQLPSPQMSGGGRHPPLPKCRDQNRHNGSPNVGSHFAGLQPDMYLNEVAFVKLTCDSRMVRSCFAVAVDDNTGENRQPEDTAPGRR